MQWFRVCFIFVTYFVYLLFFWGGDFFLILLFCLKNIIIANLYFSLTEYSKDLPTYLQYCKDVVFAGLEPPFDDLEEEKIINELWDFYQEQKVINALEILPFSLLFCLCFLSPLFVLYVFEWNCSWIFLNFFSAEDLTSDYCISTASTPLLAEYLVSYSHCNLFC